MGPNAEAAVVGFNDSVDKLQDFTSSGDAIERTFAHLDDGTSGRRLYDAMELAMEMLSSRPVPTATNPGRRRVKLVLAESDDKGSKAKLGAVLRRAQLENLTIWSVGLSTVHATLSNRAKMKPSDPGWGDNNLIPLAAWAVKNIKDQISKNGLQIATAATGGTHFATWRDRSIQTAIDEIGGELHSQIVPTGPHTYEVDGDFTIRGVSNPEKLILTISGKGTCSGELHGAMVFNRKDYGMNKGIPFIKIADHVDVNFHLKWKHVGGPPLA